MLTKQEISAAPPTLNLNYLHVCLSIVYVAMCRCASTHVHSEDTHRNLSTAISRYERDHSSFLRLPGLSQGNVQEGALREHIKALWGWSHTQPARKDGANHIDHINEPLRLHSWSQGPRKASRSEARGCLLLSGQLNLQTGPVPFTWH